MTIPVSTVPAAKTALMTALTTALPPPVLVCRDGPGTYQPDDIVSVGRVEREVTIAAMVGSGGAGWMDERYTIVVEIGCFRGGDDPAGLDVHLWGLVATVETAVRSDPTLAGSVLIAHPSMTRTDASYDAEHRGRVAEAEVNVSCTARI